MESSNFAQYKNICFIDSEVETANNFSAYLNSETYPIIYDYDTNREILKSTILKQFIQIDRVSFAFHGTSSAEFSLKSFIDNEPFFADGNISENNNFIFLQSIFTELNIKQVDFLGCNLLQVQEWKDYFAHFQNVVIGASFDNTGNSKYGADWIMESTMENVRDVYFKPEIENFASVLAISSTDTFVFENNTYNYFYAGSSIGGLTGLTVFNNPVVNIPNIAPARTTSGSASGGSIAIHPSVNLVTIRDNAFLNKLITSVRIPLYCNSIGDSSAGSSFKGCSLLNTVTFETQASTLIIGNFSFQNCTSLANISIPANCTTIGNSAFQNCTSLANISIPANCTSIGSAVFQNCPNLSAITFLHNVIPVIPLSSFPFIHTNLSYVDSSFNLSQLIAAGLINNTVSSFSFADNQTVFSPGQTSMVTLIFSVVCDFSNSALTVQNGSLSLANPSGNRLTWTGIFTPTAGIYGENNIMSLSSSYKLNSLPVELSYNLINSQTPFIFSQPSSLVYNPTKTVSILPYLSGGTTGGTYSLIVDSVEVIGTTLAYTDVGNYLFAVKSTVPDYLDYTSNVLSITITPSLQPTLLMSPYYTTYSATNNTVNLRNNAAFFGGISTSVNDINFTGTYVSNNILTYPTTLTSAEYPILATMSYPPNYYDVSASTYVIVSPPATNYQPYLAFIGSTLYETYNQSSKIIDLSAKLQNLQGGMIGSTTVFSGIGVVNNILNYTGVNTYVVVATRRFTNYYDVSASIQIIITKATQPPGFVMTLPSTRYVRAASPGNTIALSSSGGLTGEPYTIVYSSNYGVISGSTLTYDAILYSNNVFIITAKKTSPNFEDAFASVSITVMRGGVDSFFTMTNSTNHTFQYSLNNTWSSTYANTGSLLIQMNQGIGGSDLNVTQNFIFGSNLTNPLKLQNKKTADLTGTSTVYSSTFTSYSDIRLKENIQTLKETEGVNNIRVVQYNNISDNSKHFGVIAHELQEVYPGLVHGEKEGNQMQSVSYSELIPICINEIKMLKDKKKRLKTAIESLEHKLSIKN